MTLRHNSKTAHVKYYRTIAVPGAGNRSYRNKGRERSKIINRDADIPYAVKIVQPNSRVSRTSGWSIEYHTVYMIETENLNHAPTSYE